MKTREQIGKFLETLVHERTNKEILSNRLNAFFGTKVHIENGTDKGNKEVDYSFICTTAHDTTQAHGFIDFEIYYLKMREKGMFLITECEILMYE